MRPTMRQREEACQATESVESGEVGYAHRWKSNRKGCIQDTNPLWLKTSRTRRLLDWQSKLCGQAGLRWPILPYSNPNAGTDDRPTPQRRLRIPESRTAEAL